MRHPVFLDGPLQGTTTDVSPGSLDEGQVVFPAGTAGGQDVIYTVTRVGVLGREVAVCSVNGGIPPLDLLAEYLLSPAAKAAAE